MTSPKPPAKQSSGRMLQERVKTAKRRSVSSAKWLKRQLNDPFVVAAKEQGYRSRAAFKLLQLQEKYHFLKPGMAVVDLGAAPGGWSQVAATITLADKNQGKVLALDYLDFSPLVGVTALKQDFLTDEALVALHQHVAPNSVDCVLSDMAPPTTGHTPTDHIRIVALAELAFDFACGVLRPGGSFVCKVLQGGTESQLLKTIKQRFDAVHHAKPPASRKDSAEMYLVAMGFRGIIPDNGHELSSS